MIDGTKLRRLRKAKDLSVADLANQVGVTPQCLSRAESELRDLSLSVAAVTAKVLGCSIEDFLKPIKTGQTKQSS